MLLNLFPGRISMHRAAFLLIAFGVCSIPLAAQQAASQDQTQVTVKQLSKAPDGSTVVTGKTLTGKEAQAWIAQSPSGFSCPVALRVQQRANAFSREVGGTPTVLPGSSDVVIKEGQKLHVAATEPHAKRITAANVTVRGYANKSRFITVLSTGNNFDAFRTFDVHFSEDSEEGSIADFAVPNLTAVGAIDLNSVTYADGSTWKIADNQSCRTLIDGFMPVSGR